MVRKSNNERVRSEDEDKFGVKNIYNMRKRIEIAGIERQLSVSNMADGSLYGMVGARHLDGNIRPAQGLEELSDVSLAEGDRLVYVHKYGDYCHYIVETEDGGVAYIDNGKRAKVSDYVGGVKSVSSIGNMLVASTPERLVSWLWQKGSYNEHVIPQLPHLLFEQYRNAWSGESDYLKTISCNIRVPEGEFPSNGIKIEDINTTRELVEEYEVGKGMLHEKAWKENAFTDAMLIRYGLRMYDGSYAAVSPPILLRPDKGYEYTGVGFISNGDNNIIENVKSRVELQDGYKVGYTLYAGNSLLQMDADLYPYIDIFVTDALGGLSKSYIDKITDMKIGSVGIFAEINMTFEVPEKDVDIDNNIAYYRVESIDVKAIQREFESGETTSKKAILTVGEKMSYLRQLPMLEDVVSRSRYNGNSLHVYNNRLHIGDVSETLAGGYGVPQYSYAVADEGGSGYDRSTEQVVLLYYLINGEEHVVNTTIASGVMRGSELNNLISYPDARARRLIIAWRGAGNAYKIDVLLREHSMEDMAYYYDKNGLPVSVISSAEYDILKRTKSNNTVRRGDVLKVSELNNPLVFPNDKTYTVGSGKIVAMAVATRAMSQGQFGQYPLYVFTSEGIYAMLSGGGDVLYSNISPVNRHVVENAKTVCPIDNAVVYGTRQGLYVLSGSEAVNISTPLDEHGIVRNGRGIETVVATLVYGATLTEMITMRRLIAEGRVSYDYVNEEALLYKPGNVLCYAYSLRSKMWQSYKRSVDYAVDSYPELLLVDGKKVLRTSDEDSLKVEPELLLVTNAMQLSDTMSSKRIERLHLLSHFAGDENSRVLVAVAGSDDGEEYALTYKKEYAVRELHNVTLPHSASAFRYVSLIVCGKNLAKRSYINSIEVEYDEKRKER